jgi:putative nucleotidyltransferase with HDIG domain
MRPRSKKARTEEKGTDMPLPNRTEAVQLLHEWVETEGLRRHMLAVEAAMRVYARHYGEDEDLWGLTGLLHDLDYDRFPDMDDQENGHPRTALRLFREKDYPPEFIHAIEAHATFLGVPRESRLDKALLACDELTGLILACAYVRPDRDLRGVRLQSVKKKWKDKRFTAAIDRAENLRFIEELDEPFDDHLQRVLDAMKEIAAQLGMSGESV